MKTSNSLNAAVRRLAFATLEFVVSLAAIVLFCLVVSRVFPDWTSPY